MKKNVLALAGCIAATIPTTTIADVLPENLVGLNLGEIHSSSFLNQPFKGVIPFLFTSYEDSKNLKVRLAPETIFNEIGAEKHPILNNLNFQITQQNNKPVILISSDQPIQFPFLNFVLEIAGPEGSVYQDYTVLLDPASKQVTTPTANYIVMNEPEFHDVNESTSINGGMQDTKISSEELLKADAALILASLSSRPSASTSQSLKYRVRTGDSLSKIAQKQDTSNASIKTMSQLILQKNPTAFIRGDANKIKKGALLTLPSRSEINGFVLARKNSNTTVKSEKIEVAKKVAKEIKKEALYATEKSIYTVEKGDNLSKITKKFATKDISFTKMMNAIYSNNPEAFVNKSKNKIKAGAELSIPSFAKNAIASEQNNVEQQANSEIEFLADPDLMPNEMTESISNQKPEAKTERLKANQYRIKKGDTLSHIVKSIGHKEVPFAKMLKSIYAKNPNSFIDGSMTKLSIGSVITMPSLSEFKEDSVQQVSNSNLKSTPETIKIVEAVTTPVVLGNNNAASSDLIKRIRELRKELEQAKDNLSKIKRSLSQKERLLQQKNIQLNSLKNRLTYFNKNSAPELVATSSVATSAIVAKKIMTEATPEKVDVYKPKPKAEIARLKRDLLIKQKKTQHQLAKIKELKNKTLSPTDIAVNTMADGQFKKYPESNIVNFTKTNYAYLSMAFILSLLLIRYRRELYSYTYSAINYDQPSYYPIPDADKMELKEKNINYHDPKMDEDAVNYDFLTDDPVSPKVVINPVLIEAEQDLFAVSDEAKEIEHCEHLVTELFDDVTAGDDGEENTDWKDIEKVCDTYIEKIKDADNAAIEATKEGVLVEEAADFNHMMSDLLESLDKVDQSVKRNNISDDAFPDLVVSNHATMEKGKISSLSFNVPKN